eukprot:TRINITY_DN24138_c0_g1_i1.p1 TRINITY_DN24138_c0_g1~~TRINITY_DN24138_c0_g1_i1.p1  ORF type:complete len:271 (-),score=46.01 TRINITY_DN24138_c0_g1_i1:35-799(-)
MKSQLPCFESHSWPTTDHAFGRVPKTLVAFQSSGPQLGAHLAQVSGQGAGLPLGARGAAGHDANLSAGPFGHSADVALGAGVPAFDGHSQHEDWQWDEKINRWVQWQWSEGTHTWLQWRWDDTAGQSETIPWGWDWWAKKWVQMRWDDYWHDWILKPSPQKPTEEEAQGLALAAHARFDARYDAKASQLEILKTLYNTQLAQDAADQAARTAQEAVGVFANAKSARDEALRYYLGGPGFEKPNAGEIPFDGTKA